MVEFLNYKLKEVDISQINGGMIIILVGIISIPGAIFNWNIVVSPGILIPRLLGPTGAKNFMIILGIFLIGMGTGMILGII